MSKKAVILLSGGLDSTVLLADILSQPKMKPEDVLAVSIYYGQKHRKELKSAFKIATYYNVDIIMADLANAFSYTKKCSLLQGSENNVPVGSYKDVTENSADEYKLTSLYVPFRNGLFLSYMTAIALQYDAELILYGAHAEDTIGSAYPDCSPEFIKYMGLAIYYGTGGKVKLDAPFSNMTKTEIVARGLELKVPFKYTWSCYNGDERPCRQCPTCIDRERAFKENGVTDPLLITTGA